MYSSQRRFSPSGDAQDVIEDFASRLRKLIPTETQDMIAVFILFIALPLGFIFELFGILPVFYDILSEEWNWRVGLLCILAINAFVNIYKVIVVGANGPGSELPALTKPGYHYCHHCQLNEPPRSHHCLVCDKCWFRRDHHCSFVATCIGHFNQRYYIAAVVNLWLIAATTVSWNWSFLWSALGGFSSIQLWELIVPHLALLFRVISFSQFLCIMIFVFALTVLMFLTYLFGAQIFCFYRGQTRVEYLLDIHAYHLGFMENVRQAMGRRWVLTLFLPFISSPLASDGLSFPTKGTESVAESMKTL